MTILFLILGLAKIQIDVQFGTKGRTGFTDTRQGYTVVVIAVPFVHIAKARTIDYQNRLLQT